ncbi:MAG: hypothetical protein ABIN94_19935 [Ferruginibacter sp.]
MIQIEFDFVDTSVDGIKQRFEKPVNGMQWVQVAKNAPYFIMDDGNSWTPVGQNDAITWPELKGIFSGKDIATAETYFQLLVDNGVTCLRLMLEYCQGDHRYFEKPVGNFNPRMIRMWDHIFVLCEKYGLRILLTPFDTFWMWLRWSNHPYNKTNGGYCDKRSQWLLCKDTRSAIKQRLAFATERWGKSGALFAWDIWNEIHPAHAGNNAEYFSEFVEDVSSFLRTTELRLHGRCHPQTVSAFGPALVNDPVATQCIFRHPSLDFASVHFYENNTIDNPKNTVDAAIATGRLTREAISNIEDNRPFFDSEHGPIHAFKDKRKTLPEAFDDEYFLHMQWAHFASGGAGGGMRWPNRHPHSLTNGMRKAQHALARFLPLIDWQHFQRRNLNKEVILPDKTVAAFCCRDQRQAILWLMHTNNLNRKGMTNNDGGIMNTSAQLPGLQAGLYRITAWDTVAGKAICGSEVVHDGQQYLHLPLSLIGTNTAFAIKFIDGLDMV